MRKRLYWLKCLKCGELRIITEHLADVLSCRAGKGWGGFTETVLTQWLLRPLGKGRGECGEQTVRYSRLADPVTWLAEV